MDNLTIRPALKQDYNGIWGIFHQVIQSEETYAFKKDTTQEKAIEYWCDKNTKPFVLEFEREIAATFTIRPNKFDLGNHVANASYMVAPKFQGRGFGRIIGQESLNIAKNMGYQSIQFNFVISSNQKAVKLWKSLGFEVVGRSPEAFRHPKLGLIDALTMWRKL